MRTVALLQISSPNMRYLDQVDAALIEIRCRLQSCLEVIRKCYHLASTDSSYIPEFQRRLQVGHCTDGSRIVTRPTLFISPDFTLLSHICTLLTILYQMKKKETLELWLGQVLTSRDSWSRASHICIPFEAKRQARLFSHSIRFCYKRSTLFPQPVMYRECFMEQSYNVYKEQFRISDAFMQLLDHTASLRNAQYFPIVMKRLIRIGDRI